MPRLSIRTDNKRDVVDITDQVQKAVTDSGKNAGACILTVLHTTAGLTVAEGSPDTNQDFQTFMEQVMPDNTKWQHSPGSDHATDHILGSLIGPSLSVTFESSKLILGTWQRIILVELDGPKSRDVSVMILPGNNS